MLKLYQYYNNPKELIIPDFTNAKLAYQFAVDNFSRKQPIRISKIEKVISTSPLYSYMYAAHVLNNNRFEEGEEAIATNDYASYCYALFVLHGQFEKGEPTIAQSAEYSYKYAENVLKKRWPACEDNLIHGQGYNHDNHLFLYATRIIKGRWPAAEDRIKHSKFKDAYERINHITLN